MAKVGRPTKYNENMADTICERLAQGISLRTVCLADDMPDIANVFDWFRKYPEFRQQYAEAKVESADADLETIDQLDPFSEGVLFQVRPKNKSWKHMSKLSGGEKTLSSLSLIFALHIFKPSPLYCMDEIDAALDYKNVAIVGKYIKEGVCK